jgi:hypothetical protein
VIAHPGPGRGVGEVGERPKRATYTVRESQQINAAIVQYYVITERMNKWYFSLGALLG